jgi:hypothetical protein
MRAESVCGCRVWPVPAGLKGAVSVLLFVVAIFIPVAILSGYLLEVGTTFRPDYLSLS